MMITAMISYLVCQGRSPVKLCIKGRESGGRLTVSCSDTHGHAEEHLQCPCPTDHDQHDCFDLLHLRPSGTMRLFQTVDRVPGEDHRRRARRSASSLGLDSLVETKWTAFVWCLTDLAVVRRHRGALFARRRILVKFNSALWHPRSVQSRSGTQRDEDVRSSILRSNPVHQ